MWSVIPASIAGVTRNVWWTRQKLYHAMQKATVAFLVTLTTHPHPKLSLADPQF